MSVVRVKSYLLRWPLAIECIKVGGGWESISQIICFFDMCYFLLTSSKEPNDKMEYLFQFAGSFVVVDISGKEKALESGSKVACIVSQVLFYEQVRSLQKSPEW
jgi:hypothetical protein